MTILSLFCPTSGKPIDTGVETDASTYRSVRGCRIQIRCSECGELHDLPIKQGYLAVGRVNASDVAPLPPNKILDNLIERFSEEQITRA